MHCLPKERMNRIESSFIRTNFGRDPFPDNLLVLYIIAVSRYRIILFRTLP